MNRTVIPLPFSKSDVDVTLRIVDWYTCGDKVLRAGLDSGKHFLFVVGGSLGEPVKKGDGQCVNMKLILSPQKKVLLGRSGGTGWGAFIKYVLDACRQGDKLKFANHSSKPTYYCKVFQNLNWGCYS